MVLTINIEKKYAYTIVIVLAAFVSMWAVNAYGSGDPAATFGHSQEEIEPELVLVDQVILFNSNDASPEYKVPKIDHDISILGQVNPGDVPTYAIIKLNVMVTIAPAIQDTCNGVLATFSLPDGTLTRSFQVFKYPHIIPTQSSSSLTSREVTIPIDPVTGEFRVNLEPVGGTGGDCQDKLTDLYSGSIVAYGR